MKQNLNLYSMLVALFLVASTSASPEKTSMPESTQKLRLGVDSEGGSRFGGEFANVVAVERALTADEIEKLALEKPAVSTTTPPPDILLAKGFTVAAWIKPGPGEAGRIFDKITVGGTDGFLLDTYPGLGLRFLVGAHTMEQPACLKAGEWQHVAVTLDERGVRRIYLNGKLLRDSATEKEVTASNIYQNNASFGADKAFDDNDETRWATDNGVTNAWLEINFGKLETFGRAVIKQAYPELQRIKKFAIEYRDGADWKACFRGENLGATLDTTFEPVTAREFRLNITEATDGPTIWEFKLYPLSTTNANAETPQKAKPESLQAWRDARFGMFIHWGPVSLSEKEISWSRANSNPKCPNNGPTPVAVYDHLYERFNPTNFNALEWVQTAKAAGMKYMVLTAKHCDGFLLWDSKVDDYNIMHTPFKRDVCAELAKAAHAAGMKIGWYYSPMDWRDPDCRNAKNAEFVKRMQAELTELLSNYGKIDILWFDCDGRSAPWDQENTYALVRKLQPDIVIDERLDFGADGGWNAGRIGPWADFHTPEQTVGNFDQRPWESCMTISSSGQWSWGGPNDGVKPFAECLNMLIRCAGGDGNMLLDVGPKPTGEIAPEQVNRLKEMGAWLAKYGATIYDTRGGPFKPGRYGVSTHHGNTIYLHIQQWPGETLTLPAIPAKILRSQALTGGQVAVKQTDTAIEISLPAGDRQEIDTIIALELDRPATGIEPLDVHMPASHSLTTGKKATASNVYQNDASYGADKAFDDNDETRWATDTGTTNAWLEVDLGKPELIGSAVIEQAYPELKRVHKFAIEYRDGDEWKACYRGENLEAKLNAKFEPVTAQHVRLNITEASDGPTIWEFQLFQPKGDKQ